MNPSNRKPYTSLVFQLARKPGIAHLKYVLDTHTPLACLSEATQHQFTLIVIRLEIRPISIREKVFELCRCLKTNALTRKTPIVVSLEKVHREIANRVQQAGVRFMNISPASEPIKFGQLINAINQLDSRVRTDRILRQLCPFLRYNAIDEQSELITCYACGNRMVLGGKRLHEICESINHRYCEHYLNSEIKHEVS